MMARTIFCPTGMSPVMETYSITSRCPAGTVVILIVVNWNPSTKLPPNVAWKDCIAGLSLSWTIAVLATLTLGVLATFTEGVLVTLTPGMLATLTLGVLTTLTLDVGPAPATTSENAKQVSSNTIGFVIRFFIDF